MNHKWIETKINKSSLFRIPAKPGIYLFYKQWKLLDVTLGNEFIYVGQSGSLRRRINEHLIKETNPLLARQDYSQLKCLYRVFGKDMLNYVENLFVDETRPSANRIQPPKPVMDIEVIEEMAEIKKKNKSLH